MTDMADDGKLSGEMERIEGIKAAQVSCTVIGKAHQYSLLSATPLGLVTIEYIPSKTDLQLKLYEIAFVHNLLLSCQMVLKFCTEHGSITAVLCAKFQNHLAIEMGVMDKRDLVRF